MQAPEHSHVALFSGDPVNVEHVAYPWHPGGHLVDGHTERDAWAAGTGGGGYEWNAGLGDDGTGRPRAGGQGDPGQSTRL